MKKTRMGKPYMEAGFPQAFTNGRESATFYARAEYESATPFKTPRTELLGPHAGGGADKFWTTG